MPSVRRTNDERDYSVPLEEEEWKCSETHTGKEEKTYIYRGLIAGCFENTLLQRCAV